MKTRPVCADGLSVDGFRESRKAERDRPGVAVRSGHRDFNGFGGIDRYVILNDPFDRITIGHDPVGAVLLI